jgi:ketosteroid isomerase-like protein
MKSNGTTIAAAVFAVLAAFFVYQWWFNPTRVVQRRLNDIAATLSMPEGESSVARVTRVAQLRKFLAEDIRVRAGQAELTSRDAILGVVGTFPAPAGGLNVQFVDVQIRVDRAAGDSAAVHMAVEVNGRDPQTGQPTVDARETVVTMRKRDGEWVVATADFTTSSNPPVPQRP